MRIIIKKFTILVCALSIVGCSSDEAAESEIIDNAGTIERVDPRLDALVPTDANIQKLAGGFTFTEGPVWDKRKDLLYFSDVRDNTIYTWSENSGVNVFIQPVFAEETDHPSVGSNGLTLDSEGHLILMEHGYRRVSRLEANGERTTLAGSYRSNRLNSPNDVAWHTNGWLYTVIHGIIGNPRVFYDVNDQTGEGAADGMKVDIEGNIFATGPGGVWIFDPDGTHLGTIKPSEVPANVAWGDDGSTLYMTARTGLYRIRLNTSGEIP